MKWEYKVIERQDLNTTGERATLNMFGLEGWELITIYETLEEVERIGYVPLTINKYYFKRPVP